MSREFMNEAHEATTIYCHKSTAPLITVCLRNAVANGLLDDHTASSKFHILDEHDEGDTQTNQHGSLLFFNHLPHRS